MDAGGVDFFCRFRGAVLGVTAEIIDSSGGNFFFRQFRCAGIGSEVFVVVIDEDVDDCHAFGSRAFSI